jgi:hypothetical protein
LVLGGLLLAPRGIKCGTTCSGQFRVGAVIALKATPAPGWIFAGWQGACTGTRTCRVPVDGPIHVGAKFVQAPHPALPS